MSQVFDFFLLLLNQFAGGPGPVENNLVRFGLAAVLWAILLIEAWRRQRSASLPREKLLLWGFGLGLTRELYMFGQMVRRLAGEEGIEAKCSVSQPLEHGLAMAAIVVVAGAFLRYILDDTKLARRYLQIGIGLTIISYLLASWTWPRYLEANPESHFHNSWEAWIFHVPLSLLIAAAIFILIRKRGWIRNVVTVALMFFFFGEFLLLLDYATDKVYSYIICPIGNSFHILAIPILGYVYLQEQALEKRRAEESLATYRDHLEVLVKERTAELETVNSQLKQEIDERVMAETALEQLSSRNELILESASEGICGIDPQGRFTFVNPAAAEMLGIEAESLVGQFSHQVWLHTLPDGTPFPVESSPIYDGYHRRIARQGEDLYFWRQNGETFPVRYASSPAFSQEELAGAVVLFRDITEQKRIEKEIAQRNTRLAVQHEVSSTLSRSLKLETVLAVALEKVMRMLDMKIGLICLLETESGELEVAAHLGGMLADVTDGLGDDQRICTIVSKEAIRQMQAVKLDLGDERHQNYQTLLEVDDLQLLISTPLASKGKAVGCMTLGTAQLSSIQKPELELLTAVGQQIGMAIENARQYRAAEQRAEDLALLNQISAPLTSTLNPDEINQLTADKSVDIMECDLSCVLSWDQNGEKVGIVSSCGLNEAGKNAILSWPGLPAILREIADNQGIFTIEDCEGGEQVPLGWCHPLGVRALVCLPIWHQEEQTEFLLVMDGKRSRKWPPSRLELLERFTSRAAVALVNAHLHQELERSAALVERQRIFANFHDGLAQTLSLLGLKIDQVSESVGINDGNDTISELHEIREMVDQASAEVRHSIATRRKKPEPRRTLQQLLDALVRQTSQVGATAVRFISHLEPPLLLPLNQQEQVLPLVQEALWNALRHAQASQVEITLAGKEGKLEIRVSDDGIGFDPDVDGGDDDSHFGLSIMRARASQIGGQLEIASELDKGSVIKLSWAANEPEVKEVGQFDDRALSPSMPKEYAADSYE